jgi:hypothetical protein
MTQFYTGCLLLPTCPSHLYEGDGIRVFHLGHHHVHPAVGLLPRSKDWTEAHLVVPVEVSNLDGGARPEGDTGSRQGTEHMKTM